MRRHTPLRLLLTAGLVALLSACTQAAVRPPETAENPVWPPPPADARIAYRTAFTRPADLGIRKGVLARLGELLAGAHDMRLIRPMGVTATGTGAIYVADPGARGVHEFDLRRGRYRLMRETDEGVLASPVALAVGPEDRIYISDSALARVFVLERGAKKPSLLRLEGDLLQPTGLAVDAVRGRLYVVDTADHRVKVFDLRGRLLRTFGERGKGPGQFNYPTMICRDRQGRLLVADTLNFRIQIFDPEGVFLSAFGKVGDVSGSHAQPKGIATDVDGHVYVVDSLFHTVQIFDRAGRLLLNFGSQGNGPGEFWLPTGIFITPDSRIYVADSYNQRVQVFSYLGGGP